MSTKNNKEEAGKGLYIRYKTIFWGVVILILIILLLATIFQNTDNTTIKFLFFDFSAPTIGVIAFSLVIGFVGGILFGRHFLSQKTRKE